MLKGSAIGGAGGAETVKIAADRLEGIALMIGLCRGPVAQAAKDRNGWAPALEGMLNHEAGRGGGEQIPVSVEMP